MARHTVEDYENENPWLDEPEVQDFLERADEPGPWSEEDDKINTVAGLTNDKESGFMDFQKQQDENDEDHALDQVLNSMVEDLEEAEKEIAVAEEEIATAEREIEVIDPEEVSNKFEVEDTAGNVNVYDENENTDRVSTFPNENNPTSVAAVVKDIDNKFGTYPETVQEVETPWLDSSDKQEEPIQTVIKPSKPKLPPEARGVEPPEVIDEDELFDQAMRAKAEKDMKDFLKNKGNDKQD